jgi:hypothetical protein
MQLAWWSKMGIRFRASREFVGALTLGEGDWRSLFLKSGKPFTPNDLASVRKYSRLMDTINDYSEMRLVIHAFANEPKVAVDELMHAMADVPMRSIDKYVEIAREKGKELPLNDVVYESMRRMLNVLERCHTLEVELNRAEMNVWKYDESIEAAEKLMIKAKASGNMPEYRRHLGDRDLGLERRDKAARILEIKSLEFVKNRDQVEIFVNLRSGVVNSEAVAPFDMPEAFTVSSEQVGRWASLYDRALGRSVNALVKDEVTLTAKAQIGKTRVLVRDLNKLTQQISGRTFTKTQAGAHLEQFAKRHVTMVIIRIGALMGITIPSAEAIKIASERVPAYIEQLKKIIGDFNGEGVQDVPGAADGDSQPSAQAPGQIPAANPDAPTPPAAVDEPSGIPANDPVSQPGSGLPDNPFSGAGNPFGD